MKLAYFTPAYKGQVWDRHMVMVARDYEWCASHGIAVDLLNDGVINPQNSIEQARNLAVARSAARGNSLLLMCDADVCVPGGAVRRMLEHADDHVAVGLEVLTRTGRQRSNITDDGCVSAACMLVNLGELARLDKPRDLPWFQRVWNPAMTQCKTDEGIWFCELVLRLGGTVLALDDVFTLHLGSVSLPTPG